MEIIKDPWEMQIWALSQRSGGVRLGLVPTMGFLHEGHLSLVRIAREHADRTVLSLFVNPTQFGPREDLDRYPRAIERDLALCEAEGVDVVFMPQADQMYEADASVSLQENALSTGLCGQSRPVHFGGVLTVVAKLFNLCLPDIAVFGEKDAQQLRLIRRMVRDLNFPVRILPGPIIREKDGVAMSSRNANLSAEARAQAPVLQQALKAMDDVAHTGIREVAALKRVAEQVLARAPLGLLDYLEVVDDETLEPVEEIGKRPVLIAIAVQFPGARLIDNRVVSLSV
jgi:pantoate--beta-alanine ligase